MWHIVAPFWGLLPYNYKVSETAMDLYTVEVHYDCHSPEDIGELVCTYKSLFGILYTFDTSKRVKEYRVSCGANTVVLKSHLHFKCDKLVTKFTYGD